MDAEKTPVEQELRRQLAQLMAENAELREGIAQRERWIKELRGGLEALLSPGGERPGVQRMGTDLLRKV